MILTDGVFNKTKGFRSPLVDGFLPISGDNRTVIMEALTPPDLYRQMGLTFWSVSTELL